MAPSRYPSLSKIVPPAVYHLNVAPVPISPLQLIPRQSLRYHSKERFSNCVDRLFNGQGNKQGRNSTLGKKQWNIKICCGFLASHYFFSSALFLPCSFPCPLNSRLTQFEKRTFEWYLKLCRGMSWSGDIGTGATFRW